MTRPRHFLRVNDLSRSELLALLARAQTLRELQHRGESHRSLDGKTLAMLFEKSSTRTRVSFESGMAQLGGHALFLSPRDTQLGRGEPISDTARVLASMVDGIMLRTYSHATQEAFTDVSTVPVINGLSDLHHPCQLLADLQTWQAHHGDLQGRTAAWIGDGNNMCNSFIDAACLLEFQLHLACPEGYAPDAGLLAQAGGRVRQFASAGEAAAGADLVVTDIWTSMGQETEEQQRRAAFADYQVDAAVMAAATDGAIFMHCLPAHRGEEVTADVIDGARSVVWEEAENRLHAQKALLEMLLA